MGAPDETEGPWREGPSVFAPYGVYWWIELDLIEAPDGPIFVRRGSEKTSDGAVIAYATRPNEAVSSDGREAPAWAVMLAALRGFRGGPAPNEPCRPWTAALERLASPALEVIEQEALRDGIMRPRAGRPEDFSVYVTAERSLVAAVATARWDGVRGPDIIVCFLRGLLPPPACGRCRTCLPS